MKATEILSDIQNRWHNVYWFSRMLINNDKYIAVVKIAKGLSVSVDELIETIKDMRDSE